MATLEAHFSRTSRLAQKLTPMFAQNVSGTPHRSSGNLFRQYPISARYMRRAEQTVLAKHMFTQRLRARMQFALVQATVDELYYRITDQAWLEKVISYAMLNCIGTRVISTPTVSEVEVGYNMDLSKPFAKHAPIRINMVGMCVKCPDGHDKTMHPAERIRRYIDRPDGGWIGWQGELKAMLSLILEGV